MLVKRWVDDRRRVGMRKAGNDKRRTGYEMRATWTVEGKAWASVQKYRETVKQKIAQLEGRRKEKEEITWRKT